MRDNTAGQFAGYGLVVGGILLLFGCFAATEGTSSSEFYNTSVDIFWWTIRICGGVLVISSILCFAGIRAGMIPLAIAALCCGLNMVPTAVYWMSQDGVAINYILYLVFGCFFVREGHVCLVCFFASRARGDGDEPPGRKREGWFKAQTLTPPAPPQPAEPVLPHPASLASNALPKDGEPAPEEGYLAALAKEDPNDSSDENAGRRGV